MYLLLLQNLIFLNDFIYIVLERGEGREKVKDRNISIRSVANTQLGTWVVTQACTLTRNWTSYLSVCRRTPNPLSHTCQGRRSHFWLDSDSEVEILREDSLRLLAICSWHLSLASFILLATSLSYSVASSLFFLVHWFFREIRLCLCFGTHGVIMRRWILGALVLSFSFSLFRGFLTTYWWTWSLERLIEKFAESAKPFGFQAMRHNIFLPLIFSQWPSEKHWHQHPQYRFALSLSRPP